MKRQSAARKAKRRKTSSVKKNWLDKVDLDSNFELMASSSNPFACPWAPSSVCCYCWDTYYLYMSYAIGGVLYVHPDACKWFNYCWWATPGPGGECFWFCFGEGNDDPFD